MYAILEKLNDETARIDRIIFIAGALAAVDLMSDDLDAFFDDQDVEDIEACLGEIPDYVDIDGRSYERAEGIFEWLKDSRKLGFLVQFATPVMTPTGRNSRSFYWGYYNTRWIYADTLEAAIDNGLAWVAERRAAEDEKAKKEKEEKGGAA